jgi:large subunit ribosomal protein L21
MEKYAVIKLASKQFLVHEGDVLELERQKQPLDIKVLFYSDGEKSNIGEPEVSGITVKATVLEEKMGKKVRVARFKSKSRYDKVKGHRQPVSIIKIEKIGSGKGVEKPVKEEEVKDTSKKTKEQAKKETKTTKTPEKKKSAGRPKKETTKKKIDTKKETTKKSTKSSKGNK